MNLSANGKFIKSLLFLLFLLPLSLSAQENCYNGIDDDGDNLVDGFDPDCPCDEQTLICQPSCEFAIPGGPLSFKTKWASADQVPIYQTPLIADMDADGIPDIIIMSADSLKSEDPRRARNILIISGATGQTITKITTPYMAWVGPNPYAVGDIDSDGYGEIIIATLEHSDNPANERRYLYCYEHNGALKWKSNVQYGNGSTARFGSSVGIADFNRDGVPEVYVYNQIFNALTGRKVIDGGSGNGYSIMANQVFGDLANPIAADITSSPGLELVCGNTVYNVVLTNNSGLPGNSMTPIRIPNQPDGYSSVADINLDGKTDVIVASGGVNGQLYVWNPNEGNPVLIASANLPNTGGNWIGVPFIGDMDKDCEPEIGVTRSRRVYAFDYDGTQTLASKWTLTTSDASGFTGITMFDFNQDGTQELVYRDETTLRIIDGSGSTPVIIGTQSCSSGTGAEMPVVADVDGDGQAEICVTCATTGIQYGKVHVFEADNQLWAPCRPIWNQYNYFNVNINSNLTIPRQQQPHQVLLSTDACPFYTCNENRPFNTFMTQATLLTKKGCPIYPASDVRLDLLSNFCQGSSQLDLLLRVSNVGPSPSDSGYEVSFYAGDPLTGPAQRITPLNGIIATNNALNPGEHIDLAASIDILDFPKPFKLTVLLNDNGSMNIPFSFPVTLLPECDYLNNVVTINNLDCCPSGDLAITGYTPPLISFCSGSQGTVTVHASSTVGIDSTAYTWTFPDNSQHTGASITTGSGGNYSVQVQDSAHCKVNSSIQLNEIPLPTTASAGADQVVCVESATLNGNTPNTGTGLWTVIEGAAQISNPASPNSTVTALSPGINRFRWTITNGGICISDDTVAIQRDLPPSVAYAGLNQDVCADASALNASIPTNGTGKWTRISGTGVIADSLQYNSPVTGLSVGNNVFRWTVSNGVCPASTDNITIKRFAPPSLANAGSNQTICSAQTTMAATQPTIGKGKWTLVSGTGLFADSASFNSTVSGLSTGANVFRWTVTNGPCAASTDDVVITRNEEPTVSNAGTDQQICTDATALGAVPPTVGTGSWSLVSGSGTIADAQLFNSAITGLSPGVNVFAWTVSNGVCPPSVSKVNIRRDLPPTAADAGANQQICSQTTDIQGNSPTIGIGKWSLLSGSGSITDSLAAGTTLTGMSPGNNIFQWQISNGVCPASTATVTIQVDALPNPVNAGTDIQVCANQAMLAATLPVTGSGAWTLVSGTATVYYPALNNSSLSGLAAGTTVLRWTVINGTCSDSDEVSVTRFLPPTFASAGTDQIICATTANLDADTPATGTGQWSVASGNAQFSNSNNPKDQISGLSTGDNILVWTISNGVCTPERDTVIITVSANPIQPNAGRDSSFCGETAQLSATAPPIGTGTWSVFSGSASISEPSNNQTTVTNLSPGVNVFKWTVVNGACEASDQVNITRDIPPSVAVAGDDQLICTDTSRLNANTPVSGTGSWSLVSGQGTIGDVNQPVTTISALQPGTHVFRWTISSGVCTPSSDEVSVEVQSHPTVPAAGSDQNICTDTLVLNANTPLIGTGLWTVISGNAAFDDAADAKTVVRSLSSGVTVLRWTISNGICPPLFDEITLTREQAPSAADAGPDQQVCADTTRMNAVAPITGTGSWTVVTGSGTIENPASPDSRVSQLGLGVNVFQWNVSNGNCPPSADQVIVIRDSGLVQANAGADIHLCAGDTVQLHANDPFPSTGSWSVVSGTAIFDDPADPNTVARGLAGNSATLRWTIVPASCPGSSDDIEIINDLPPETAFAGSDTTICGTVLKLNAKTPSVGTGQWQVLTGTGQLNNENLPNTLVSNLSTGVNLLVWTVSNGVCTPSTDTLKIMVDENPLVPNAGADQTLCADTTRLSAAATLLGVGSWSVVSGSASFADSSLANTAVSNLSAGDNILRWTVSNGICKVYDEVSIRRDLPPSGVIAGTDQTVCGPEATLNAQLPLNGNGTWSVVSGSANIDTLTKPNAQVRNLTTGITIFRWTVRNGVCPDSSATVSINRLESPSVANAGPDFSICQDTARLAADPVVNGTGSWSVVSGSATIDNPSAPDAIIRGLVLGTVTLRWTIAGNGSCPGSSDELTLTRDTPPSVATLGADTALCANSILLTANTPAVGTGRWLIIGGNASVSDSTATTATFSNLSVGNNVFEWRITSGSCPPSTDQLTVFRSDTAYAGQNQTVCDSAATLQATAALSGKGFWTLLTGTGILADSSLENTVVSNLSEADNVFVWTITGSLCADTTDTVTITRKCNLPPVITNDSFEINEDSVLTATFITPADYDPDSTLLVADTIPISGPSHGTVHINPDGTFTYRPDTNYYGQDTIIVRVCDNGIPLPPLCDNDTIIIRLNPVNDPPVLINENLTVLVDSVLTGNILLNRDYDPDSTTLVVDTIPLSGPSHGSFNIDSTGQFTYLPDSAFVGADTILIRVCDQGFPLPPLCGIDTLIIQVKEKTNTPPVTKSGKLVTLEDESGSGTMLIGDYDPDGTTLSVDTVLVSAPKHGTFRVYPDGSYTYTPEPDYYGFDTVIVAVCDSGMPLPPACSNDTLFIEVQPVNDPPNIVSDTVNTTIGTTITGNLLLNDSDKETALIADTIPLSGPKHGTLTLSPDGSFSYKPDSNFVGIDTVIVMVCDSGYPLPPICLPDTLFFMVQDTVLIQADAGPDQSICGFTTRLSASPASPPATGSWSIIEGSGIFTEPGDPKTWVTGLSTGANRFVWRITNGAQTSADTVLITANPPADTAFAGPDRIICGNTTTMDANVPLNGQGFWSLIAGNGTLSDSSLANAGITDLNEGENILVWTIQNGPCASTDTVIITAFEMPQISAGKDTSICPQDEDFRLYGSFTGKNIPTWSVIEGNAIVNNPDEPQSTLTGLSAGKNILAFTLSNGPCSVSDSIVILLLNGDSIPCKEPEIFIPEGFSPDQDGTNDKFVIYGLNGKRVEILIFNRWGTLVYKNDSYKNDWDGTCNQPNVITGDFLPEGTYYYIIKIEGEKDSRKGYLTLWR